VVTDEPLPSNPGQWPAPQHYPDWPPPQSSAQWQLQHQPDHPPLVSREPETLRGRLKRALAPLAGVGALLAKFGAVLLKLKAVTVIGTMAISLAAYATIWGWKFALGFVLLIFVHEMGHVIQLRREGIRASAPTFVPFLGAVITSRSLGDNALAEARVGLAGPILGSIGSLVPLLIYHATGNPMWRALAFFGFYLNLFNLIPLSPLDGGRAMAAMAPWMWILGFVALAAVAVAFKAPIMILFLIVGGWDSWRRWQNRRDGGPEQEAYYRVSARNRLAVAVVYIGLAALLVIGLHSTYTFRGL
jgi:Zn-dependent protease